MYTFFVQMQLVSTWIRIKKHFKNFNRLEATYFETKSIYFILMPFVKD